MIGQIFDTVYPEGNLANVTHNVQTTAIPAGGSAITEFKMSVPGTFIIVDHSLTRAFNRGALAQLKATANEDKLVYSGKQFDLVYQPEGTGIRVASANVTGAPVAKSKDERIKLGAGHFRKQLPGLPSGERTGRARTRFRRSPSSDFLNADKIRAIKTVTGGLEQKVVVNGKAFNGVMPAWDLSDEDIANVLTFVYSQWGNAGHEVTPEEVKEHRVKAPASSAPVT